MLLFSRNIIYGIKFEFSTFNQINVIMVTLNQKVIYVLNRGWYIVITVYKYVLSHNHIICGIIVLGYHLFYNGKINISLNIFFQKVLFIIF